MVVIDCLLSSHSPHLQSLGLVEVAAVPFVVGIVVADSGTRMG